MGNVDFLVKKKLRSVDLRQKAAGKYATKNALSMLATWASYSRETLTIDVKKQ